MKYKTNEFGELQIDTKKSETKKKVIRSNFHSLVDAVNTAIEEQRLNCSRGILQVLEDVCHEKSINYELSVKMLCERKDFEFLKSMIKTQKRKKEGKNVF